MSNKPCQFDAEVTDYWADDTPGTNYPSAKVLTQ
jgi:hypothetical protein